MRELLGPGKVDLSGVDARYSAGYVAGVLEGLERWPGVADFLLYIQSVNDSGPDYVAGPYEPLGTDRGPSPLGFYLGVRADVVNENVRTSLYGDPPPALGRLEGLMTVAALRLDMLKRNGTLRDFIGSIAARSGVRDIILVSAFDETFPPRSSVDYGPADGLSERINTEMREFHKQVRGRVPANVLFSVEETQLADFRTYACTVLALSQYGKPSVGSVAEAVITEFAALTRAREWDKVPCYDRPGVERNDVDALAMFLAAGRDGSSSSQLTSEQRRRLTDHERLAALEALESSGWLQIATTAHTYELVR